MPSQSASHRHASGKVPPSNHCKVADPSVGAGLIPAAKHRRQCTAPRFATWPLQSVFPSAFGQACPCPWSNSTGNPAELRMLSHRPVATLYRRNMRFPCIIGVLPIGNWFCDAGCHRRTRQRAGGCSLGPFALASECLMPPVAVQTTASANLHRRDGFGGSKIVDALRCRCPKARPSGHGQPTWAGVRPAPWKPEQQPRRQLACGSLRARCP